MSHQPLLYPERRRCRTCRKSFAFQVILRLYCSRSCAGLPEQPADTDDLPRKCRVRIEGVWRPKRVYFTSDEAERCARTQGKAHWYLCEPPDGCGMYHLTKKAQPYIDAVAIAAGKEN